MRKDNIASAESTIAAMVFHRTLPKLLNGIGKPPNKGTAQPNIMLEFFITAPSELIKTFPKPLNGGTRQHYKELLSLGALYYAGGGVRKDETEALAWFMLSAAAGNTQATRSAMCLHATFALNRSSLLRNGATRLRKRSKRRAVFYQASKRLRTSKNNGLFI